jgi:hypothetical protein
VGDFSSIRDRIPQLAVRASASSSPISVRLPDPVQDLRAAWLVIHQQRTDQSVGVSRARLCGLGETASAASEPGRPPSG